MIIDCEQSLFFFRFSGSNARAPSVTRVAICVSRVLLDGLQKKERLLVVYMIKPHSMTSAEDTLL